MTMLWNILTVVLLVVGTAFAAIGSVGILVMPDVFMRMSATTKAATLGVGFALAAAAAYFHATQPSTRSLAVALFLLLTAPIGAHMIGRAAYLYAPGGVPPLCDSTCVDEMAAQVVPAPLDDVARTTRPG